MPYHYTPRTVTISDANEDVEQQELSYMDGGNTNGADTVENSMVCPQKVKRRITI